jgi:hypothetical protein
MESISLLEAGMKTNQSTGLSSGMSFCITRDGEAANIGRKFEHRKLVEDHVGHRLLTVWC